MGDNIRIDQRKVEEDAVLLEGARSRLERAPLDSQDMKTTLSANAKSKAAYGNSQERLSDLSVLLDQEVKNIRSLGAAFVEFDEMAGAVYAKK